MDNVRTKISKMKLYMIFDMMYINYKNEICQLSETYALFLCQKSLHSEKTTKKMWIKKYLVSSVDSLSIVLLRREGFWLRNNTFNYGDWKNVLPKNQSTIRQPLSTFFWVGHNWLRFSIKSPKGWTSYTPVRPKSVLNQISELSIVLLHQRDRDPGWA